MTTHEHESGVASRKGCLPRRSFVKMAGLVLLGAATGACTGSPMGVGATSAESATPQLTGTPRNGPVTFVTGRHLARARHGIRRGWSPHVQAWRKVRRLADFDLDHPDMTPSVAEDKIPYRRAAIAANYYALAAALVHALDGNPQTGRRAVDVLCRWARHGLSAARGDAYEPVANDQAGQGIAVAHTIIRFAYTYTLVHDLHTPAERRSMQDFFALNADVLRDNIALWHDRDYFRGQRWNNHLSAHSLALALIGYVTGDRDLVDFAFLPGHGNPQNLLDLVQGAIIGGPHDPDVVSFDRPPPPQAGEIYDRYQSGHGIGLVKTLLNLRYLVLAAEAARNNRYPVDLYDYRAPTGEHLLMSLEYYTPFFVHHDPARRSGYYANEHKLPLAPALDVYEIANLHYDSSAIREVLAANKNLRLRPNDVRTHFGPTISLTHAVPLHE